MRDNAPLHSVALMHKQDLHLKLNFLQPYWRNHSLKCGLQLLDKSNSLCLFVDERLLDKENTVTEFKLRQTAFYNMRQSQTACCMHKPVSQNCIIALHGRSG